MSYLVKTIHKLDCRPSTKQTYAIRSCCTPKLLHVGMQDMNVKIWYECTPDESINEVEVLLFMTGENFDLPHGFIYAGTAVNNTPNTGPLVVHVYVKGFDVSYHNK